MEKEKKKRPPVFEGQFIGTGVWVREHLLRVGSDYAYSMWRQFTDYLKSLGISPLPSYQSFARYLWVMKKAKLIEPLKQERSISGRPRVLYRIAPGKERLSDLWINPQYQLYGEKVRLGKRRYARRVLKVPPKPIGRPPKTE